ncbi:MAG: transposase [Bacteroidota bacterium]|nr:transposase [Bacteroidota bacterium]
MKSRRKYDRKFKQKVVELSYKRENIADMASELGIRKELIFRWRCEKEGHKESSFPGNENKILTKEQKEIVRLKKELKNVEVELDTDAYYSS